MAKLSEVLRERGYAYQFSAETLEEIVDTPRTLYWGVDPSADSMHIGQLMGMLVVRRFVEAGHKVIFLAGGATGLIGDPGGKNQERPLLDTATVSRNVAAIEAQAKQLLQVKRIEFVNNADWLGKLGLLEFLRDTGKYETVNAMIKRETVEKRIKDPKQSISFAEFSYMLLQAHDFWHLFTERGVEVQVGASDQWGNIVSGVDLIKHKEGKTAYAFTWPLLINKTTGKKFGKSEAGTIWLDADKTSPFELYQFLLQSEDDAVGEYLLKLTMLPSVEIDAAMELHKRNPGARHAQRLLARAVTTLVHGDTAADKAEQISDVLFGDASLKELDSDAVEVLARNAPSQTVQVGDSIIEVLVSSGLAKSKREARQFIESGAIILNVEQLADDGRIIADSDFTQGVALLKRGRRSVCVLRRV